MNISAFFPEFLKKIINEFKLEELEGKEFPLSGTFAFADISGFTKLSEELMKLGTEGSEILNNTLNFYYENIIKIIKKYSGDVLTFAGDAISCFFEREENAINSSIEIQNFFKEKGKKETPIGSFDISIKIGLSTGKGKFYFLKEGDFSNFVFEGDGINFSSEAEHKCNPGEIILYKNNSFIKIEEKISLKNEKKIEEKIFFENEKEENILFKFLNPFFIEIFKKAGEIYLNEHKNCVILFVNLKSVKKNSNYFKKV